MKVLSFADIQAPFHIVLNDYRKITLSKLHQHRTYSGLLLGLPREEQVSWHVESALSWARSTLGEEPATHLLPYDLVEFEQVVESAKVGRDMIVVPADEIHRTVRGRCLPAVTCAASFESRMPVDISQDSGMFGYSVAHLIWFQDNFGLPAEKVILKRIRELDWATMAVDATD